MDNQNIFVTNFEYLVANLLKSPNLKMLLSLLSQSPIVVRFCDLVAAISRPRLISPETGSCVTATTSTNVVIGVGNSTGTYTINIIDSFGSVIHSCPSVSINPGTLQGTCMIPPGVLTAGENYTVEVVTSGISHSTIGWFCAS